MQWRSQQRIFYEVQYRMEGSRIAKLISQYYKTANYDQPMNISSSSSDMTLLEYLEGREGEKEKVF